MHIVIHKRFFFNSFFYNVICCLLLTTTYSIAQQSEPVYRHYTTEEGLPSSEVYHVIQDSKGYIWFATNMGVCRYDGYRFKTFTMNEGLPDNTVFEIFEDYKGRIWFVPFNCKLTYFENGKIVDYKYNSVLQKKISGTSTIRTSFYVNNKDEVHIGIYRHGYFRIDAKGNLFQKNLLSGRVHYELIRVDTAIFFPVVYPFIDSTGYHTVKISAPECDKIFPEQIFYFSTVIKCLQRKNKDIILTFNKVMELNCDGNSFIDTTIADAIFVYEDSDENLWVGTLKKGVKKYPSDLKSGVQSTWLNNISVSAILQDREGGMWFATLEEGVYYIPSREFITYDKRNFLWDDKTTTLTSDGTENIFAGFNEGGILKIKNGRPEKINLSEGTLKTFPNLTSALNYDSINKKLWMSKRNYTGYISLKEEKEKYPVTRMHNNLRLNILNGADIIFGSEGSVWIGFWNRLYRFQNDSVQYDSYIQNGNIRISTILEDSEKRILIGSLDGLKLLRQDGKIISYPNSHSLLQNRIVHLNKTSDGVICAATRGAGILFIKNDNVYQLSTASGLSSENTEYIWVENDTLWVATNKGINRVTVSWNPEFSSKVTNYTKTDGLASDEVNQITILNGKVWAATNKGISVFDPKKVKPNSAPPPIYITRVKILDRDTLLQSAYENLSYNQNFITVHFTGISFKNPGNILYRYRMSGLDTNWLYTKSNEIQYTTLPPGSYQFEISAANDDGVWSTQPATIGISIQPPYWETWWFRITVVLAIISASGAFVYTRYRRLRIKLETEKRMVELEAKALRTQMNPHFIFNSLNSIQSFISGNDNSSAERYLARFARLIRLILENSRSSYISIATEKQTLEYYLELEQMRFKNKFGFTVEVDEEIDENNILIPPMLVQPHVENAILHGLIPKGTGGKLEILFTIKDNHVICTVTDDGIGRKQAEELKQNSRPKHNSQATLITKERLELMRRSGEEAIHQKITDLYSETGQPAGTRVELSIPWKETY